MSHHERIAEVLAGLRGGKQPKSEQIERIYAMINVLNVRDNDSFIVLIIALDFYWSLFAEMPGRVREAARKAADEAEKQINVTAKERIAKTADDVLLKLGNTVRDLAEKSAMAAAGRRLAMWICVTVAVCVIAYGMVTGFAQYRSYEAGYSAGVANARDENLALKQRDEFWTSALGKRVEFMNEQGRLKEALDFADSSTGRLVMEYGVEHVDNILRCESDSWSIEQAKSGMWACFTNGRGFRVPQSLIPKRGLLDKIAGS